MTGLDVLGLILGKTDTPALRRLESARGILASEDDQPVGADDPADRGWVPATLTDRRYKTAHSGARWYASTVRAVYLQETRKAKGGKGKKG